jgi:hypothetical protein
MMFVGFAITILFMMSSTALWRRNFRETVLFLSLGAILAFLFYRKRLALLAAVPCGWIVVNGGLTSVFHSSVVRNTGHIGVDCRFGFLPPPCRTV